MPSGQWKFRSLEDISTHTSDDGITESLFTVPDREVWDITSVWAEFTASANLATAREIRLLVRDAADDIIMEVAPGAAATVSRDFLFFQGAPDLTAARDTDLIMTALPSGFLFRPGWDLVVRTIADTSATDGDSDDMVVQLTYAAKDVLTTDGATPQTSDN